MGKYDDPRWQKLRLLAFERDGWACCNCTAEDKPLHAHHKRYSGELWRSPLDDLQTLCEDCHAGLGPHPKAGVWWEDEVIVGPNARKTALAARCEAEFVNDEDGGVQLVFWDRAGHEAMTLGVSGSGVPSLRMRSGKYNIDITPSDDEDAISLGGTDATIHIDNGTASSSLSGGGLVSWGPNRRLVALVSDLENGRAELRIQDGTSQCVRTQKGNPTPNERPKE